MKIAYISRNTLHTVKGGDTMQIVKTAEYLEKMGVCVDIYTSASKIDYSAYDVLHGFNVIRPADLLAHFRAFKKARLLSPIYVNYREFEAFARGGLTGTVFKWIGNDRTEYLKAVMRRLKNGERSVDQRYLLKGHRASLKELVALSDMLLPNSESEYRRLAKDYGIDKSYAVVPNAIDTGIFKPGQGTGNRQLNLVICVARIDGVKNQLNLIRALKNTEFELILIGKPGPNQGRYYEQCRREATANISFVPEMSQQQLLTYYQRAQVHAMPSWFETTGLSSLEAAASCCKVVISDRGDTRDYFGDQVFYADPADPRHIYAKVQEAAGAPCNEALRNRIFNEYTWEKAAQTTLSAYQKCLNGYSRPSL